MSNGKKIAIIIACVMTGVGILVMLCAAFVINFDFSKLSTVKTERVTYTVEQDFDSIHIDCMESDVRFVKSDSDECIVECVQYDEVNHTAEVKDGTLNISRIDEEKLNIKFGIYWDDEEAGITVHLPENEYEMLWVKTLSGDVAVPDELAFSDAEIYCTSGDIVFLAAVSGNVTAESVSGDIALMNSNAENISVKSTSGDAEVSSVKAKDKINIETVSGDMELSDAVAEGDFNVKTTSGDIEINKCDAGYLYLKSTSGDISGTLLSEKIFSVHTTSGYVNVPDDGGAEKCEINTTSGDVKMRIAE